MIEKINFLGLHGASSPENRQNISKLATKFSLPIIDSMDMAFSKIDKASGDKDVFIKSKDNGESINFTLVDSNGEKIAKTDVFYDNYPSKSYCPLESMSNLSASFVERFSPNAKEDNSSLDKIFNTYA